ncbi:hypothetical protein SAMN02745751_00291 [Dethiosulfatibacter aminovorans DSM 17477]|uniref:DUF8058 domain-containing protein n=1 Tax=Dethiosulfatibacter aminovorans DSM 17477 TaxID=1121476 RepID=A0A1M6AY15_9FIRM|nr:hypothetical protein [Dethiosulfatibacter aminovorans]SHI41394.1 hypothetical protein SAMN02745751_00291 [Dethiosulfatibacter aminovorans DSM 17477]
MKKVISVYSIFLGASIILLWIMLFVSNNIPELSSSPLTIYFHITAESIMALISVSAGYLLLRNKNTGYTIFLIASGSIIYSVINSSGYYAHSGNMPMVYMFAVLLILQCVFALYAIVHIARKNAP